jgi:hypothetical protein
MQRSIRFPDELDALIQARAEADDRSFSYVVLRTLESALSSGSGARTEVARVSAPPPSEAAPVRAPEETPLPKIARRHWQ